MKSIIFDHPYLLAFGAIALSVYFYTKSQRSKKTAVIPLPIIKALQLLYRTLSGLTESLIPPHIRVLRLTVEFLYTKALYAVCELNVADHLASGPLTPRELAIRTGAVEDRIRRLIRALVQRGIFYENKDGTFSNNAASDYLRTDHPESQKYFIGVQGDEIYEAMLQFMDGVKGEKNPFDLHFDKDSFELYKEDRVRGNRFAKAMSSVSNITTPAIVHSYKDEWNKFNTVVDVGGSQGTLLEAIMTATPKIKGILFDLPEVIEESTKIPRWQNDQLLDRVKLVGGSFFEEVPTADLYTLRFILHDWSDQDCIKILRTIRKSIPENGKVLIFDQVFPSAGHIKDDIFHSMFIDMIMMCIGGKERTAEEFEDLFHTAGFKLNRIIPTSSPVSIVEAVPVRSRVEGVRSA